MPTATRKSSNGFVPFTAPGLSNKDGSAVVTILQNRLNAVNDLALTLKHVHWNVVGPQFIGVHKMLDKQVKSVREMVDQTAERIAALGGSPVGTPGALVEARTWDDYSLGRADTMAHLGALDIVYDGIISSHRDAIDRLADLDLVTQDMVIGHCRTLEQFHWFIRAHLESSSGKLSTDGASHERQAAKRSRR
jgi:starvation-inducible DNA-binding protein